MRHRAEHSSGKSGKHHTLRTYISLFSSAGIGCYGFKLEGFECIATCELLPRRLKMQSYNRKCRYDSGYIGGDMTKDETKDRIFTELKMWKTKHGVNDVDVIIATPPCQGMSVANHKKGDELKRNSLVVESLIMVQRIRPKFFVFENVRAFLSSICTDIDGKDKTIKEAIECDLGGTYNIYGKVLNFKDYGNNSSRPRTLVLGVRKDIKEVTPLSILPDRQVPPTLRELIGHLPSLTQMGELWDRDLYHGFRSYDDRMREWIAPLKEGECAFDNKNPELQPHHIVDGNIIPNVRKNSDKYTRQFWDKVAPCVHTRNDILASQNTVHPSDDRVFSIRELMLMMSIPDSFQWSDIPYDVLNSMSDNDKKRFLKREEVNIRQNLGEAVPTIIFKQIAHKVKDALSFGLLSETDIQAIITEKELTDVANLITFIRRNHKLGFVTLSKIAELANAYREDNAAFYTGQDIAYAVVKKLPDFSDSDTINILEPSVGLGNFLPSLFVKYANVASVNLDVCDIDGNSIQILKELLKTLSVPRNFHIQFIVADSLLYTFSKRYDVVVGNPPYKKISSTDGLLTRYRVNSANQNTNNLFAFFIDRAIALGDYVAFITPKSLINAPEFNATRALMSRFEISSIIDYGETAFKGVKIETVSFVLCKRKRPSITIVESYITNDVRYCEQSYITDATYPYWLIYRNSTFDNVANKLSFDIFTAYRDRAITKKYTNNVSGRYRVLKSRNIRSNGILDIPKYDTFIDNIAPFGVARFLNADGCFLVPNLTYYPRACRMPKDCIVDGSVAILLPKDNNTVISDEDLAYYESAEFTSFYKIARNRGTRSLNIDNNSVFFFGILKK